MDWYNGMIIVVHYKTGRDFKIFQVNDIKTTNVGLKITKSAKNANEVTIISQKSFIRVGMIAYNLADERISQESRASRSFTFDLPIDVASFLCYSVIENPDTDIKCFYPGSMIAKTVEEYRIQKSKEGNEPTYRQSPHHCVYSEEIEYKKT